MYHRINVFALSRNSPRLIGLLLAFVSYARAQQPNVNFYPISALPFPNALAAGPDGALWLGGLEEIARLSPSGQVTAFNNLNQICGWVGAKSVVGITSGPDGALWFVGSGGGSGGFDTIGRFTTDGQCSTYTPPGNSFMRVITVGPDGALWFTELSNIGRVTTTGQITEYPVPATIRGGAYWLTAGPDGALWFASNQSGYIGRITTTGQVTTFPIPSQPVFLGGIAFGPDGALWFLETFVNSGYQYKIARFTTSGLFAEFPFSLQGVQPSGIVAAPDGAMWISTDSSIFGRITMTGNLTVGATMPRQGASGLIVGPDGNLWFLPSGGRAVGEILLLNKPSTTATLSGLVGNNGWYRGGVTVTLSATEIGGSVASSWFSVDGGAYLRYTAPFSIPADGVHQLSYYSVDTANQQETPQSEWVKIDGAKPVSTISALPAVEKSPTFSLQWSAADTGGSGLDTVDLEVSDNGGPSKFLSFRSLSNSPSAASGQWNFNGACGHSYGFYSFASDIAGNVEGPKTVPDATTAVPGTVTSRVSALPGTAPSPNIGVQWSETDACSSIRFYNIYVADDGGPFTPWLSQTTATRGYYQGSLGHTYGFYSIGVNYAGSQESAKTVAEAITQVPAQMAADVNGDGKIDCADVSIVKAAMGTKTGQPGFNPRADVNSDGIVDVRDLAAVTQKLVPGTVCP